MTTADKIAQLNIPVRLPQELLGDSTNPTGTAEHREAYVRGRTVVGTGAGRLRLGPGGGFFGLVDQTLSGSVEVPHPLTPNTGGRDGTEVVLLYVTDDLASVSLPRIRLRGVVKRRVAAGERVTVTFSVAAARDLTLVDERLRTVVEPGTFTLSVGSASDCLHQRISLTVS
ncbi:fibronectin type III-like domain-contianing protein [Streptomyces sp. NPDC086777]|uniref:fibronectin type III-like domain-contianing protein n=1 Tax=Streptomyces sp. NPDC086777 TaxID=3154866 RepID=UPI00344D839A